MNTRPVWWSFSSRPKGTQQPDCCWATEEHCEAVITREAKTHDGCLAQSQNKALLETAALSWAPFGRAAFPLLVVIRTPAGFPVNGIEQRWVKNSPSSHSLFFRFVQLGLLYCSTVHQLSHFMAFYCLLNQRAALFFPLMNLKCKELGHFSNYTIPFLHLLSTNILKWSNLL